MRLVRILNVRDGMELARDIPHPTPGSMPLLRNGVKMTERTAQRLHRMGVRAIWVQDLMGEGIEPLALLPEHVRLHAEAVTSRCMIAARNAAATGTTLPVADVIRVEEAVLGITNALLGCPEAACALDDLATADSYTHTHSVRVTTLGLMLATRMLMRDGWRDWNGMVRRDGIEARLVTLGTGLLVHDIGKISIPAEILNKPGKLTAEEWDLIKTHPDAGVSLLDPSKISPLAISVVRDHHERWDGAGYPGGKQGPEIHNFARLAAVADTYDAVTADRPYRAATDPHVGVRVVLEGSGTQFDPEMVEHFRHVVMPYPLGYAIQLPDGREGVIAEVDPLRPERPTVRYVDGSGQALDAVMEINNGTVVAGYEGFTPPLPADARHGVAAAA